MIIMQNIKTIQIDIKIPAAIWWEPLDATVLIVAEESTDAAGDIESESPILLLLIAGLLSSWKLLLFNWTVFLCWLMIQ